jgi:glutamate/aspartate transport system permease protein
LGRPVEAYLLAAIVYFVLCYALSRAVQMLQKKIQIIR